MPSKYDDMKASDIKGRLKDIGMSQVGDKGTMIYRLDLFDRCSSKELTVDGTVNPCLLKAGDLKKHASKLGISPMLTPDEILAELVTILEASKKSEIKKSSSSSAESVQVNTDSVSADTSQAKSSGIDAVGIAKRVLELSETDDYEEILNIATPAGAPRISKQTPLAIMRKAYLKLSLIIHPDKLGRSYDQATKAFQALVSAFDRLSSPDVVQDEDVCKGKKGAKIVKIARSNEGCYRTRVCCPRCKQIWSEGTLDGNPDYFYNFMMTGLKQFSCSTCLCEFGCMTAIHKCPQCQNQFEYSPQDYHRKLSCGRQNCQSVSKPFGFFCYSTSDRVINDIKKDVKAEQERRLKARESKQRRAKRMDSRGGFDQDKAFLLGLLDCCPRCGETFDTFPDEDQRLHLMECTDDGKQAAHKAKLQKAKDIAEMKEKRQTAQEDVQTVAAWQFLGAKTDQLWLLNEDQLRRQAEDTGLDTLGDKDDLISRIAGMKRQAEELEGNEEDKKMKLKGKNGRKVLAIGNSSSSTSFSTSTSSTGFYDNKGEKESSIIIRKKSTVSVDSLPSNLHSLSAPQLRSVCAANNLLHLISKNASKSEILNMIENEVYHDGKKENVNSIGSDDKSDDEDDVSIASNEEGSDIEILS